MLAAPPCVERASIRTTKRDDITPTKAGWSAGGHRRPYKRVFDMVEVGRTDDKFAEGIFLSDGTVNLSVVRFKTEQAADRGDGLGSVFGLHHIGFWVENEDETRRRLKEASAEYNFTVDRPDFYEEKYKGPDAVMIDIADAVGLEQSRLSAFRTGLRSGHEGAFMSTRPNTMRVATSSDCHYKFA